jgi:hypothetical protein
MAALIWVKAPIMQLPPDADTFEQLRPHGPKIARGVGGVQALFERIVEQTFGAIAAQEFLKQGRVSCQNS